MGKFFLSFFIFCFIVVTAQVDKENLTFVPNNSTDIPTPRICLYPGNASQTVLDGCDYLGYTRELAVKAIPAIVVVGVFSIILYIFLLASCCIPCVKVKWCQSCYKLNIIVKLLVMFLAVILLVAGFALIFSQHFTQQAFFDQANSELDLVNFTVNNVSANVLAVINDPRSNKYQDLSSFSKRMVDATNYFNDFSRTAKDVLRYVWIGRTTVSFFSAGIAVFVIILFQLGIIFNSIIILCFYSFFGLLLLIGADLDLIVAVILHFVLNDLCTEVSYQKGLLYYIQQKILEPVNSGYSEIANGIRNATFQGCTVVDLIKTNVLCCSELLTPACSNITLPEFDLKNVTDFVAPPNLGSGLTYLVRDCAFNCTGNIKTAAETISDTGFTVTSLNYINSQLDDLSNIFGNHFTNNLHKWSCTEKSYVPQLFAAAGCFIVGLYLATFFTVILYDRRGSKYADDDDL